MALWLKGHKHKSGIGDVNFYYFIALVLLSLTKNISYYNHVSFNLGVDYVSELGFTIDDDVELAHCKSQLAKSSI